MPGVIRYWIDQTNEYPLCYSDGGHKAGLYVDLLNSLGESAGNGCEFRLISENDGSAISAADALDMLKTGSLDMVLGLPAQLDEDGLTCNALYDNVLTAIILKDTPQAPGVENCFWGIDSALLALTEGTQLEGHVLDYNGTDALFEALESGSVYGILVRRSMLDNYVYLENASQFREYPGIKLPYTDCAYTNPLKSTFSGIDPGIAEELKDRYAVYSMYSNSSLTTGVEVNDPLASYYNKLSDAYGRLSLSGILAGIGIAGAVLFGILAAVFASRYRKTRSLNDARLQTLLNEEPDKELFEIDLTAKTIRAYKDFTLFGVKPGSIKNPIKLDALSGLMGYDFSEHFSKVSLFGNTIYKNRFIIYAGGRKLYIAESGHRTGHILTVTMTLLRP